MSDKVTINDPAQDLADSSLSGPPPEAVVLAPVPSVDTRDLQPAGIANLLAIAAVIAATPKQPPAKVALPAIDMPIWPKPVAATEPSPSAATDAAMPINIADVASQPVARTSAPVESPLVATPIEPRPQPQEQQPSWPRRMLRYAGFALAGYATLMLALIVLFRFINPPGSALMVWRSAGGTDINRAWVPISNISPNLVRAVIVAEDWTFCAHHGVDMAAMQEAIEKAGDGIPRGASTISMQTVKNVFLWPSKSYVRKAIELPMTLVMELLWPKRRVLEVYLNVAEWGPGIFGAEAASRHHFNKSASKLTSREAAQLAASLPNPFVRDAGDPGPRLARKATTIQNRMRIAGGVTDCVGIASDSKAP